MPRGYTRTGARLIKPRTAKQHAQAKRYGDRPTTVGRPAASVARSIEQTAPKTSWWLATDRTEFSQRAAVEEVRMRESPFAHPSAKVTL